MTNIITINLNNPNEYIKLSNMIEKLISVDKKYSNYFMLYSKEINYITIFKKETNNLKFARHIVDFLVEEFNSNILGELITYMPLDKAMLFKAKVMRDDIDDKTKEEDKFVNVTYMLFSCDEMVEEVKDFEE